MVRTLSISRIWSHVVCVCIGRSNQLSTTVRWLCRLKQKVAGDYLLGMMGLSLYQRSVSADSEDELSLQSLVV